MSKQELTAEQKQRLKIGSFFGIGGLISMIASIICFFVRSSKVTELADLPKINLFADKIGELESAISVCTAIAVIFLIVTIVCLAMSLLAMYKAGIFNKETK